MRALQHIVERRVKVEIDEAAAEAAEAARVLIATPERTLRRRARKGDSAAAAELRRRGAR